MARAASALLFLFGIGCANPRQLVEQPHLDFGLSMEPPDLSVLPSPDDLSSATDGATDQSVSGDFAGAVGHDFSVELDLSPEEDLRPAAPVCDLAGGPPSALWMAGVAASNALFVARFQPAGGWHTVTVKSAPAVDEVALALSSGLPELAERRQGDSLDVSRWDACADDFPSPAQIFANAVTLQRPALVGGSGGDLVFRGQVSGDQRLYHSHSSNGVSWGAAAVQGNMLTTSSPVAVSYRGAIHAIFTGSDGHIYDGTIVDSGNGGTTTRLDDGTHTSAQPPAAIVDGSGRLVVLWAQTSPDNIIYFSRAADGTTTSGPTALTFTSPRAPVLALDAAGNVVMAFSGDDKNLYVSSLSGNTWSGAVQAATACGVPGDCHTTLPPALAPGVGGGELELVYVRDSDGKAAHVRRASGTWSSPAPFTSTNFLNQPALVVTP